MLRVVADTNIYVSALNFGGVPLALLELAEAGGVRLITSDAILDETERVLRDKFAWADERVAQALEGLRGLAERAQPTHTLAVVTADPSDNRVLECADAGGADVIVSGDRHLLALHQHGTAPILRVADFLRQFEELAGRQQ